MPDKSHDKHLFMLIATGDEHAFGQVFHSYNKKLFPFICSITKNESAAEEIVQETFLRLWIHRSSLTKIDDPAAWLMRVASNLALNYIKRTATYSAILQSFSASYASAGSDPGDILDVKKIASLIAEAVDHLPGKRREIYRLSREKGMSRQEIASLLQVSESTVKNQMTAALKFIQEYVTSKSGIYLPVSLLILFS